MRDKMQNINMMIFIFNKFCRICFQQDNSDYLTEILNRTDEQFQNFLQCMFTENTPDPEDMGMRDLGIDMLQSLKDTFINRIVSCLPAQPIYK